MLIKFDFQKYFFCHVFTSTKFAYGICRFFYNKEFIFDIVGGRWLVIYLMVRGGGE